MRSRTTEAVGAYATIEYDDRIGGVCVHQGVRSHYTSVRCVDGIEIRKPEAEGQLWRFLIYRRHESVMDVPFHGEKAREFHNLAVKIRGSRWTISAIELTTPSQPSVPR